MPGTSTSTSSSLWTLSGSGLREAEFAGRQTLRSRPLNASALSVVARAHYDRGDDAEAIRLLGQAIHADPHHYPSYDALIKIHRHRGQRDIAAHVYDEWAQRLSAAGDGRNDEWSGSNGYTGLDSAVDYIANYYATRAPEYDATCDYMKMSNAAAIDYCKTQYQLALRGKNVIEIACGTGFWTEVIAATARSVLATDRNSEQIAIVQAKFATNNNVRCQVADAYSLNTVQDRFDAAFAHFWWSHIPKSKLREFLTALHSRLEPGALVIFSDSLPYLHEARRLDEEGNVLEVRRLRNGERYEIIKNFPLEAELRAALEGFASNVRYLQNVDGGLWTVSYNAIAAH